MIDLSMLKFLEICGKFWKNSRNLGEIFERIRKFEGEFKVPKIFELQKMFEQEGQEEERW